MKPLCIYHGNCADGFASAWVVRRRFGEGNVDFHAGVYGQEPPDVTGRDVVIVDFSYRYAALDTMAGTAKRILVLDHHKTAAEDLARVPIAFDDWENHRDGEKEPIVAIFDMNRSGAMITWDFFFPGESAPRLLHHIQDRDLWLFNLDGTREIQATVFSFPYDFAVWDRLMDTPVDQLIGEGRAIERKHHKDIAELVGVSKRRMKIGGHDVPVANLPYTLSSDAGHLMAKGEPFAACYMDNPNGRVFSLRAAPGGVDVSIIAKGYGGGGHKAASGFTVPIGWEGDRAPDTATDDVGEG